MTSRERAAPALLAGLALTTALASGVIAQGTRDSTLGAPASDQTPAAGDASATWNSRGITVRFPRAVSPDRIAVDAVVPDLFSGYEWRVVLEGEASVYLVALVIPPDPVTLVLHRYPSIEDAIRAGGSHIRRCERDLVTLRCGRPARALVRIVDEQLEFVISELRWLLLATEAVPPAIHLGVHRARQSLWATTLPLRPVPD